MFQDEEEQQLDDCLLCDLPRDRHRPNGFDYSFDNDYSDGGPHDSMELYNNRPFEGHETHLNAIMALLR